MEWITAVFSPTRTTATVASAIMEGIGVNSRNIDLLSDVSPEEIAKDSALLVCMPVYYGRVPAVALKRLGALKGNGGPAIAVVVYGNRDYDDALLELKDALTLAGFRVIAAAAFVAEHSLVRSIAAGRPNEEDRGRAKDFGMAVVQKMALPAQQQSLVQVPGNSEYKAYTPFSVHPKAEEGCSKCGLCVSCCPVGAIPVEEPGKTLDNCINCMRCVMVCPHQARALPGQMVEAISQKLAESTKQPKSPVFFL